MNVRNGLGGPMLLKEQQMQDSDGASGHAMLVISVASPAFDNNFLSVAIPFLLSRHSSVMLLIADELMIYNRFQLPDGASGAANLLLQYRQDRQRQLEKLVRRLDCKDRTRIGAYDDFCDQGYSRILRRLFLIALEDPTVMTGLGEIAHSRLERLEPGFRRGQASSLLVRSLAYLIDETAWTINLAAHHGVSDNYYPGDVGSVLKTFYCRDGLHDIFTALDIAPHVHRYWRLRGSADGIEPQLMWQVGPDVPPSAHASRGRSQWDEGAYAAT